MRNWKRGWRSSSAPKRPAYLVRAISPIPASFRCWLAANGLVLLDELSHACIYAGAQLSGGKVLTFRHNDVAHVRELLAAHRAEHDRALIVTDGVFSMDGDLAPLAELLTLADEYDAWLMSDDAHGVGVIGGGHGSSFVGNTHIPVPLQMGTLSKATGSYGGYLCASAPVIELMRNRARTLIYSTGLPPASVAAAIAAPRPDRARASICSAAGTKGQGFHPACWPARCAESDRADRDRRRRDRAGLLRASWKTKAISVIAIRPPTVPVGTARLRLTFTAQHPDDEIGRLADIVREKILA